MSMRTTLIGAGAVGLMALAGCAPTTPVFDRGFGESARILHAQQVRDPAAAEANRDRPVDGLDGRAAKQALDRYQKSFGDPPKAASPFLIGVGAGTESGGDR
ncbi:hypothetical protein [Quisquiliibacterium transsilvanicum]|uniref:Pilus assembly protein n=1 Tax=Quisquiliibacterium transsilvanicum TaxID=1549638 RepID=A0A7W8HGX1_9BURK|nr:hypothetical protein [Quisquiliibacterium transsilvanicum]MBB5271058.1 hypothetical protein [Quisquiliibacterium transsilvanicum]